MRETRLIARATTFAIAATTAAFSGTSATAATAADFPTRSVRVVVPSTPGGALDILSCMPAQELPERWNGQPLIVDNRAGAGAGGIIGSEIVAKSEADGYTLLVVAPDEATRNRILVSNPEVLYGFLKQA